MHRANDEQEAHLALGQLDVDAYHEEHQLTAATSVAHLLSIDCQLGALVVANSLAAVHEHLLSLLGTPWRVVKSAFHKTLP